MSSHMGSGAPNRERVIAAGAQPLPGKIRQISIALAAASPDRSIIIR